MRTEWEPEQVSATEPVKAYSWTVVIEAHEAIEIRRDEVGDAIAQGLEDAETPALSVVLHSATIDRNRISADAVEYRSRSTWIDSK